MSSANTSSEANRDDGCEWYFGVPFPSKRKAARVKERELKVGDRVRANGGYTFDPIVGVIVEDEDKGGFRVRANSLHDHMGGKCDWFYYDYELTLLPPTFASGTRVRVSRNTNHYAVGDTGTVTVSSDESVGVIMDNGRYWSFKPEDLAVVPASADPAPDCARRNGGQACWPAKQEAKPKFKAGDVVGYKPGSIMGNSRYTIKCVKTEYSQGKPYDGPTAYDFTTEDGWETEDNLVLVASAPCPQDNAISIGEFKANLGDVLATACGGTPEPCIVMRLENGQPRPSSWPHVHQSAADATKEAERLASVNPGKQFDVYRRVTGRVGDVQVREVA